jgi:hypothetical protein
MKVTFREFRFVVVLTLTVAIIAGLVALTQLLVGNAGAALVGLAMAGVASKLFEAVERSVRVPQDLQIAWTPPQWFWSALGGILIVQASGTPASILGTSLRILHGGNLGCSGSTIAALGITELAGFTTCGYIAGRITPSRATIAVTLGLIVLATLAITDMTGASQDEISKWLKCFGQVGDSEDVYSFRFGAVVGAFLGLIPRAFLSLYAAALGARHQNRALG